MNFNELSIHLEDTPEDLATRLADDFVTFLNRNNYLDKPVNVAFSGGSTPNLLFAKLAKKYYKSLIDWNNIHIFQVDERWVPLKHNDNNFNTLKSLLLNKIDILEDNLHRMPVMNNSYQEAQDQYILELKKISGNSTPLFDLTLLGMGDDGHTASIFPGEASKYPSETDKWVSVPFIEKLNSYRMTLSAKVLLNSKHSWFHITGLKKAKVLYDVIYGDYNPKIYPSQLIGKSKGLVEFYLDINAYSKLKTVAYKKPLNLKAK